MAGLELVVGLRAGVTNLTEPLPSAKRSIT
jgi:hypothetical protein